MDCAPQWLLDKAVNHEVEVNWSKSNIETYGSEGPSNANFISSHFVYKIKNEDKDTKRLMARLFPPVTRKNVKDQIRKDSATVQFDIIRLVCSIASI